MNRKPQINFQTTECIKALYEEAKASGLSVPRLCAAGLVLVVTDPDARARAVAALRDFEEQHAEPDRDAIRRYVEERSKRVRPAVE